MKCWCSINHLTKKNKNNHKTSVPVSNRNLQDPRATQTPATANSTRGSCCWRGNRPEFCYANFPGSHQQINFSIVHARAKWASWQYPGGYKLIPIMVIRSWAGCSHCVQRLVVFDCFSVDWVVLGICCQKVKISWL